MELKIFGVFVEKYWDFLTFYLPCYLLLTESPSTFKGFANFQKVDFLCQKLSSKYYEVGLRSVSFVLYNVYRWYQ